MVYFKVDVGVSGFFLFSVGESIECRFRCWGKMRFVTVWNVQFYSREFLLVFYFSFLLIVRFYYFWAEFLVGLLCWFYFFGFSVVCFCQGVLVVSIFFWCVVCCQFWRKMEKRWKQKYVFVSVRVLDFRGISKFFRILDFYLICGCRGDFVYLDFYLIQDLVYIRRVRVLLVGLVY